VSVLWSRPATAPEQRSVEQRSVSYQDVFGSGGDVQLLGSGVDGALRLVPLFAAVRLIADQFCATPLHGYRERADGTRERMARQPSLISRPPWGSVTTWKGQLIVSLLTWGNAYGLITQYDSSGWPAACLWTHPGNWSVDDQYDREPVYYYEGRRVDRSAIIHVPWIVLPGRAKGLSPVGYFKVLWETGQAAQTSARDWYVDGAIPSVHLKNDDQRLDAKEADKAKARYKDAVSGRDALVTGKDWSLTTIGLPADEARFIEQLKMTATQVASIYGIAPEEIGGERGGSSLQYSTLEMDDLRLSGRTMRPWYVRCEDAFTNAMPRPQYAKFNADALVRADMKTRMETHQIQLDIGLETQDEARRVEDKAPLTDQEKADWLALYRPTQKQQPVNTREGQP
jgi:HK97 family phage portal protein